MDDLVAFLKARLDEDEKLARAAAELCGCHPATPHWEFDDSDEGDGGRILIIDHPHPNVDRLRIEKRWNRTYSDQFMARHIARHDPARVLAEVKAKRLIVDRCEYQLRTYVGVPTAVATEWLTLRLLALPYADHPDYRADWAPPE